MTIATIQTRVNKAEPVLLAHAALWVLALVGEYLVGRTHLVNTAEWSAVTSYLTPIITTAVLAASAWITRELVSPAAAFAERVEAEVRGRIDRAEQAAQGLYGTAAPGPKHASHYNPEPVQFVPVKPAPDPVVALPAPAVDQPVTVPDPT